MRNGLLYLLAVTGLFLLAGCASRIPPSGGPKDTKAPEIISTLPANSSVGFAGNVISLTFSEFIQLKDIAKGILISPPVKVPPEFILKGKNVQIRLKENLLPNTTYTFLIGKSIIDLTEGNELKEYALVFSTGNSIDSMRVSGNVKDAFTNRPVNDALVVLYPALHDSMPSATLPVNLARTDGAGNYTIKNIRAGSYMIFALQDGNANYKYDLPEEKIGFREQILIVDSVESGPFNFRVFVNPQQRQRLLKKEYTPPGKIMLKYAVPVDSWKLRPFNAEKDSTWFNLFEPGNDSLIAWVPRPSADTLSLISQTSENGISRFDTLQFNTKKALISKGRKGVSATDTALKISTNLINGKLPAGDTLVFTSSRPLHSVKNNRIKLYEGADSVLFDFPEFNPERASLFYKIPNLLKINGSIRMTLLPGTFTDMYGLTNDTIKLNIAAFSEEDIGNFELTIQGEIPAGKLQFELTDKAGKMIASTPFAPDEPVGFYGLQPGQYGVRLILDTNGNGKWSAGNFNKKIQPETIMYFPGEINIRAGWDLELTWDLSKNK